MSSAVISSENRAASVSELALPEPSDGELVTRAQRGDSWAEEALFRRHVGRVMQVAVRLLGRTPEADDAVQDSFVIALEQLGKLRDGAAFRSWLLRIVVHQAHRRYRKRRLLTRLGFTSHDNMDSLGSQCRDDLGPELRAELVKLDLVLERVSPRARTAWVLRYVEGYQLHEIAQSCGCSLATADKHVRKHVQVAEPVP
jgi:RNA polymerase sigma-70 factor (ECF subfamily)